MEEREENLVTWRKIGQEAWDLVGLDTWGLVTWKRNVSVGGYDPTAGVVAAQGFQIFAFFFCQTLSWTSHPLHFGILTHMLPYY